MNAELLTEPVAHPRSRAAAIGEGTSKAHWSGVLAMAVCVFALIASEFLPVSLLTPIAADLKVTEGMVGQGISVSAIFAVVTSLSLSAIAGRMNRKTLMLLLTAVMCLSGAIIATSTSYWTYMVGRALIGVVVGGFWSMTTAMAMRLVPPEQVPRALAIFNGGNALATIVAPPLGSYLGAVIGWRGAFLCLVPLAAIAFAWQWYSLPSMHPVPSPRSANPFKLLQRRDVAVGMLGVSLFFMGQFTLFTYVRPYLESVTGVGGTTLSLVLLTMGVAGVLGTAVFGVFQRLAVFGTLIAIPLVMAIIAGGLMMLGHWMAFVVGMLALWAFVATPAPVGWWTWLTKALPDDAEAGGGLMVAVVQLAIGIGSTVGGLLFDHHGYQGTFGASAVVLASASVAAYLTARAAVSGRIGKLQPMKPERW